MMRNGLLRIIRLAERVVFGGPLRERALLALLDAHYRSVFRRQWRWSQEPPHFFDHRLGMFDMLRGRGQPLAYTRGYHAAEVIRPTDRVLDIGCGDGFFTSHFYAPRCREIDALDIEPTAIQHAQRHHPRVNVRYVLADAVSEPFPQSSYDVIVWDGALGHFAPDTLELMLEKIAEALTPDGVFVGSESLGTEGTDHLQFFDSTADLHAALNPHFAHVELRQSEYPLPGLVRREAYWRCAPSTVRLGDSGQAIASQ